MKVILLLAFLLWQALGQRLQHVHHDTKFLIRHSGGLCVAVGPGYILRLDSSCNQYFTMTSSNKLKHQLAKKCVSPVFRRNGTPLKVIDCSSSSSSFKWRRGSILHTNSGKCIHPFGGSAKPARRTRLVLYSGCYKPKLSFKLEYAGFLIQHWGGLCMTVKPKTNRLFLSEACDRFELKSSKALRHLKSGKCVVPESTRDNSFFRLQSDCTASHFAQTAKHSLKHLETGKCFHPRGGKSLPVAGTPVVIYYGCDQTRLEFTFVP